MEHLMIQHMFEHRRNPILRKNQGCKLYTDITLLARQHNFFPKEENAGLVLIIDV